MCRILSLIFISDVGTQSGSIPALVGPQYLATISMTKTLDDFFDDFFFKKIYTKPSRNLSGKSSEKSAGKLSEKSARKFREIVRGIVGTSAEKIVGHLLNQSSGIGGQTSAGV